MSKLSGFLAISLPWSAQGPAWRRQASTDRFRWTHFTFWSAARRLYEGATGPLNLSPLFCMVLQPTRVRHRKELESPVSLFCRCSPSRHTHTEVNSGADYWTLLGFPPTHNKLSIHAKRRKSSLI